mmetsp:Transcript_30916/g.81188  ORF Transcript_30916/g.81188 Transcript_30916/m.81188 type:complete len:532 (+) Transcript_30916:517-2112(+)
MSDHQQETLRAIDEELFAVKSLQTATDEALQRALQRQKEARRLIAHPITAAARQVQESRMRVQMVAAKEAAKPMQVNKDYMLKFQQKEKNEIERERDQYRKRLEKLERGYMEAVDKAKRYIRYRLYEKAVGHVEKDAPAPGFEEHPAEELFEDGIPNYYQLLGDSAAHAKEISKEIVEKLLFFEKRICDVLASLGHLGMSPRAGMLKDMVTAQTFSSTVPSFASTSLMSSPSIVSLNTTVPTFAGAAMSKRLGGVEGVSDELLASPFSFKREFTTSHVRAPSLTRYKLKISDSGPVGVELRGNFPLLRSQGVTSTADIVKGARETLERTGESLPSVSSSGQISARGYNEGRGVSRHDNDSDESGSESESEGGGRSGGGGRRYSSGQHRPKSSSSSYLRRSKSPTSSFLRDPDQEYEEQRQRVLVHMAEERERMKERNERADKIIRQWMRDRSRKLTRREKKRSSMKKNDRSWLEERRAKHKEDEEVHKQRMQLAYEGLLPASNIFEVSTGFADPSRQNRSPRHGSSRREQE